ncbi:MAG: 2'-5' RNA ligase family protein [Steroidobacteraceae bacterium]
MAAATQDVVLVCGGRPMPPENFHVTLAFVGSVPESSVAKVEAVGYQVAAEAERAPVQITMDAIEYWKKAKVVCATAQARQSAGDLGPDDTRNRHGDEPAGQRIQDQREQRRLPSDTAGAGARFADALAFALKSRLTAAGFTPDLKPFHPHVTLARKVPHGSRDRAMQSVSWRFTEYALVESRTQMQGAVYRVLESFSLVGP